MSCAIAGISGFSPARHSVRMADRPFSCTMDTRAGSVSLRKPLRSFRIYLRQRTISSEIGAVRRAARHVSIPRNAGMITSLWTKMQRSFYWPSSAAHSSDDNLPGQIRPGEFLISTILSLNENNALWRASIPPKRKSSSTLPLFVVYLSPWHPFMSRISNKTPEEKTNCGGLIPQDRRPAPAGS